jgi:hypothetical protein
MMIEERRRRRRRREWGWVSGGIRVNEVYSTRFPDDDDNYNNNGVTDRVRTLPSIPVKQ